MGEYIYNALDEAGSFIDVFRILEVVFAFDIYDYDRYVMEHHDKNWYFRETVEIFEISDSGARTFVSALNEVLIVPAGEKKLDEELVNPVFSFLQRKSNEHFISALQSYEQKKWVTCAEGVRRAIEEYLRGKLRNSVGLQGNIIAVGKILKSQKSPVQVRNIVAQNLGHLDQFFNANSKHNDGDLEESDAEFLIYQTALLMRYIEKYVKTS